MSSNRSHKIIRNVEEGPSPRHKASAHVDVVFKPLLLSFMGMSIPKYVCPVHLSPGLGSHLSMSGLGTCGAGFSPGMSAGPLTLVISRSMWRQCSPNPWD